MRHCTLLLAGLLLGCSSTQTTATAGQTEPATTQVAAGAEQSDCCTRCPLALPGTKLSYAESTGGGSMIFSAPDTELTELRARVEELAAYHNQERQKLAMMTIAHDARAVAIDGGARLEITTSAGNDLPALQREIENEVQWLQAGNCELSGEGCTCGSSRSAPLSGSSTTQAPTDPGAQSAQPAGPTP
jgi:hypothetical protein